MAGNIFGKIQYKNRQSYEYGIKSLDMANEAIGRGSIEGNIASMVKEITKFNFNLINYIRVSYSNKDFGYVFEKYINN